MSHSQEWLKLLHYRKSLFGGYHSDVRNQGFFLAADGVDSPQAELEADIAAFRSRQPVTKDKMKPSCVFPARFQYLQKMIGGFEEDHCASLDEWRHELRAESVTLVFSSYFPGAPASMFGHTFLKINRAQKESVLDYSIDYSAMTDGDNVVVQSMFGLVGLYHGEFSVWPYYVKIKEYNNAENRDIFEYTLNLTPQEVETLVLHIWEMRFAKMPYTFFLRNCSYEVLSVIQAVKPNWHLMNHFLTHVLPIDTVRVIDDEPNSIRTVHFRSSLRSRLVAKWDGLGRDLKKQYFGVIKGRTQPAEINDPLLAEALGLHYTIRQIENKGHLPTEEAEVAHAVNVRRSQLPPLDENLNKPKDLPRPDHAHPSDKIELGLGNNQAGGGFVEGTTRIALHALYENDAGYSPNSELESFVLRGRYYKDSGRFSLQDTTLFRLMSLNPMTSLINPMSYEFNVGVYHPPEARCEGCIAPQIRFALGKTMTFSRFTAFLLAGVQFNSGNLYEHNYRYGTNLRGGLIYKATDSYKIVADARWNYFFNQRLRNLGTFELTQGYSWAPTLETHLRVISAGQQVEGALSQAYYF
jgi:hypothetical protein